MVNELRQIIKDDFSGIKMRREGFSLRAYARLLGVNPTSLSLFLSGKRGLSIDGIKKVCERLSLEFRPDMSRGKAASFTEIDLSRLRVMSDWYFFAILSLAETKAFRSDPRWISRRLNIPIGTVKRAIATLERLDLLQRNSRQELVVTGEQFRTPDHVPSVYIRRGHFQALDLAKESLERDSVDVRNISGVTIAIDPKLLPKANVEIKKFRRKMMRLLESGNKQEVYRLCIQLFPLSRGGKDGFH